MTDTMPMLPDYDTIDEWFLSLKADATPAELHGQLSGLIAGNGTPTPNQWLAMCTQLLDVTVQPGTVVADGFCALIDIVSEQFRNENFGLQLLIPDDDIPLSERVEGLSLWCQGFLTGFSLAGNTQQSWNTLPKDSREILTDITNISQVATDNDEEEYHYLELLEYVRLGAIHIWLALTPPPITGNETKH